VELIVEGGVNKPRISLDLAVAAAAVDIVVAGTAGAFAEGPRNKPKISLDPPEVGAVVLVEGADWEILLKKPTDEEEELVEEGEVSNPKSKLNSFDGAVEEEGVEILEDWFRSS
jgi:hypothetical protein